MKKQEIEQKKYEALKMYLQGMSKDHICKTLHSSEHTLIKWEKEGDWIELYNEVCRKTAEKLQTDIVKEKERSLKLIHGAEAIIAQKIQSGEIEGINIHALASLLRTKQEILMPKAISQYNLIRQENIINLKHPELILELVKELNGKDLIPNSKEA